MSKLQKVRKEPFKVCVGLRDSGFYWEIIKTYEIDGVILGIKRLRDGLGKKCEGKVRVVGMVNQN